MSWAAGMRGCGFAIGWGVARVLLAAIRKKISLREEPRDLGRSGIPHSSSAPPRRQQATVWGVRVECDRVRDERPRLHYATLSHGRRWCGLPRQIEGEDAPLPWEVANMDFTGVRFRGLERDG